MSENKLPEVGDFLYSSWGYDQSNVEFYKVVRVSESSVWLQEWESVVVKFVSDMANYVLPGQEAKPVYNYEVSEGGGRVRVYAGKSGVFRKKWSKYGGVNLSSFAGAWLWDGQPKYESHYA